MRDEGRLHSPVPILIGASAMLSLSMGLRQSFGLILTPLTRDIAVSVSDFTLAMAVQTLGWGLLQPVAGALAVRIGFRRVMVAGGGFYLLGLLVLAGAHGFLAVLIGAGLLIGLALACTASAMALAVGSRAVSNARRSLVLGLITAAGSLGAVAAAPLGQTLTGAFGWRAGVIGFAVLALAIAPAAWVAGRVDSPAFGQADADQSAGASIRTAIAAALRTPAFLVMAAAYFVCGMQLMFVATHLPSYLALCGMDPLLSAEALGMIGISNVFGGLFFGWAGGRWSKLALLGSIYFARSTVLGWYFILPPTPASTLVFAGLMGFLWLGVGPLVAGAVAEMFGLRWQPMLQGVAFMSHQLGGFVGAFGGGLLFDVLGSYDLAWRCGVAIGLVAGVVQVSFALLRPARRVTVACRTPSRIAPA
jgi:predicted MFS family arabinose efflux permease